MTIYISDSIADMFDDVEVYEQEQEKALCEEVEKETIYA